MIRVADVCSSLGLPYFVTGSLAGMRYGEVRFTQDVDIVIELPSWKVREFCAGFPEPEFYVNADAALMAAENGAQFNIIWTENGVKADIIAFRDTPFNESRLARARAAKLPTGAEVVFSAPEDVLLHKLVFFREGGSDKHTRDIASMIKISGSQLDYTYIEAWALRLGVVDQWRLIQERMRTAGGGSGV